MSTHPPTNVIYTGVAGTGKTYRLLQLAKQYTDELPMADSDDMLAHLVRDCSWREVICLVLLERQRSGQDLIKVPELVGHAFFRTKALLNGRDKHLANTAWAVLQAHSTGTTQQADDQPALTYFVKDNSGAWSLAPNSEHLTADVALRLEDYQQACADQRAEARLCHQRYCMVSFHQDYGYEEFVEGIRPVLSSSSKGQQQANISYEIQDGAFLQLCQRALQDPHRRYAVLIDEINRANVSRVFGELLSLIEPDKRIGQPNTMSISLAYSGRTFAVPANVDIYATMNTQDQSLAPLDMALRRRFRFIDCPPDPDLLLVLACQDAQTGASTQIDLAQVLTGLNTRILQSLGRDAQLGHAFLWSVDSLEALQSALIEQIIPQVAQAADGQLAVLQYIFNDTDQPAHVQFIQDGLHASTASTDEGILEQGRASAQGVGDMAMDVDLGLGMGMSGGIGGIRDAIGDYQINVDLLAGRGEFANPSTYLRLYR